MSGRSGPQALKGREPQERSSAAVDLLDQVDGGRAGRKARCSEGEMKFRRGVNWSRHCRHRERLEGRRQGPGREAEGRSRGGEPMGRYFESSNPEGPINSERVAVPGDRRSESTKSIANDSGGSEAGFGRWSGTSTRETLERRSHGANGSGAPRVRGRRARTRNRI